MGKRKRKKIPQKEIVGYVEPTESDPQIHPDATLSPTASLEDATTIALLRRDSTTAPAIGEEEDKEYAGTMAGLLDKYFLSRKYIPFSIILVTCAIVSGVLFIQDNNAGLLTDVNALIWTIKKCAFFFGLVIVFWICLSIVRWLNNRFKG